MTSKMKIDKRLGRKHFIAFGAKDLTVVNCCGYKKWAICLDFFFFNLSMKEEMSGGVRQ